MITKISFKHFKGFKEFSAPFDRLNLLVGGNNSGKTSLFHALQLVFWCIDRTVDVGDTAATFRKTQVTGVDAVPAFSTRDLFFNQQQQLAKKPARIELVLETDSTPALRFEIYRAFSRNLMIDGADQRMTRAEYDALAKMRPVYIPGTIGITVQEEYIRAVSQQRLITEGRQNQVLRNLLFRLKQDGAWTDFVALVRPLFLLNGMNVPFDMDRDEWLTATYQEGDCDFDIVSAGSGFLQTLNLLCFLFLNESRTALLDEPDSHMHDDLQRVVFAVLDRLSRERKLQIIIATHSATLVDVAGLQSVLLIDRRLTEPKRAQNVDALIPLLTDRGLALPPNKVIEVLRTRRALFVEAAEADYEQFVRAFGEVVFPGFSIQTRDLKVFEMGGAEKKWPFEAIDCFKALLGTDLSYVYLSDRDFLTDAEIDDRLQRAVAQDRTIAQLERRHRESYLLDPVVLARLFSVLWERANPGEPVPDAATHDGIRDFVLAQARDLEDDARTDLLVQHEGSLRGDHAHRSAGTKALQEHFRLVYSEPLARGEIPYVLLDAKRVLRSLRADLINNHRISFSDLDICSAFLAAEVPSDLRDLLERVRGLFPPPLPPPSAAQQLTLPALPPNPPTPDDGAG